MRRTPNPLNPAREAGGINACSGEDIRMFVQMRDMGTLDVARFAGSAILLLTARPTAGLAVG